MEITAYHKVDERPDGYDNPPGRLHKWAALFFGIYLVWVFMFIVAPWMEKFPVVRTLTGFVEERGIDASALYYTEVEEASVAELNMYNTMHYMPRSAADNAE